MTIDDWRREIDRIDHDLLRLLNRRAHLALKVGELKKAAGRRLADPSREREILRRVLESNSGPLGDRTVAQLFRQIIRASRRVQSCALRAETMEEIAG